MTDNNYDYEGRYEGEEIDDLLDIVKESKADIQDIDNIRKNAALGATALQSVPDEYVTEEELEGKGYAVARNVANALATKVTAVKGKGLSTEDFTTALKDKLEALSNYDDSEIAEAIEKLRNDIDTLVDGDTTKAIDSFNEIIEFLKGIDDRQSLDSIIASIEAQIASKQDAINDLASIREGAGKGATAVQGVYVNGREITPDANGVADLGEIGGSDMSGYATLEMLEPRNIGTMDTTSEVDDVVGLATTAYVDTAIASAITTTLNTPV